MNRLTRLLAGAVLLAAPAAAAPTGVEHVLLISIDGMHALDLSRFIQRPENQDKALTQLAKNGVVFPHAFTPAPSDSFPGMVAQITGGTPRSTGVYYDDSYDRTLFAPENTECEGDAGAEVSFTEDLDRDRESAAAGGILGDTASQIDPARLPRVLRDGACVALYPHEFLRTNTVFELVRAHGGRTAWADKHPAYEILQGPSGAGIDDLFTPEIDSRIPGTEPLKATRTTTNSYMATRGNDELRVQAVLNEINGRNSTGARAAPVPALFGMNFQAVSVGQKLPSSGPGDAAGLIGGYEDASGTPGNALGQQLDYVDSAIGRIMAALRDHGLERSTLVIMSARHGQSPIDRSQRVAIKDRPYDKVPGYGFHVADDVALVWLDPKLRAASLAAAHDYLLSQATALGMAKLLDARPIAALFADPAEDPRAPDFVAITRPGVVYTGGRKLAEHGGFAEDDRNVSLVIAGPGVTASVVNATVGTTQIAPTILAALGIDPEGLQSVQLEHTARLPGLLLTQP